MKRLILVSLVLMLLMSSAMAEVKVGDIITFGHYPQNADGKDRTAIEWIVLDVNDGEHSALLLSRYALDAVYYYHKYKPCTWKRSSIREWLNGKFMQTAFVGKERNYLLSTMVACGSDQSYSQYGLSSGPDSKDKVFLLSYAQAEKYLGLHVWREEADEAAIACRCEPTAYAMRKKAYLSPDYLTKEDNGACPWGLRSMGMDQVNISGVGVHGMLTNFGIGATYVGVRPAIRLNLKKYDGN